MWTFDQRPRWSSNVKLKSQMKFDPIGGVCAGLRVFAGSGLYGKLFVEDRRFREWRPSNAPIYVESFRLAGLPATTRHLRKSSSFGVSQGPRKSFQWMTTTWRTAPNLDKLSPPNSYTNLFGGVSLVVRTRQLLQRTFATGEYSRSGQRPRRHREFYVSGLGSSLFPLA